MMDYDIQAMRSWSQVFRHHVQQQRDRARPLRPDLSASEIRDLIREQEPEWYRRPGWRVQASRDEYDARFGGKQ